MRRISRASTVRIAVVVVIAAAACVSSIASSSAKTARAASSGTVDFYSSLPMQGASSAQTVPIAITGTSG